MREKPNREEIRKAAVNVLYDQIGMPLPLPIIDGKGSKKPLLENWQKIVIDVRDVDRYFQEGCNIGLRLDRLTDVDLDCMEAVHLAPAYLKMTPARFGRESKRNSHHIYRIENSKSIKFENIPGDTEVKMLCEIRHGNGFQTMIPPSVHPSGELVRWEANPSATPAEWDYPSLVKAMGRIAAGALLARQLRDDTKTHNIRHYVWVYLAGAMALAEWPVAEAMRFCELVSGMIDDKVNERLNTVERRFTETETGDKTIAGLKKLEEYLDKKAVAKIGKWLDLRRAKTDDLDLSDDGNAQTLYADLGDDLHYLPNEAKGGLWLQWNGIVWGRDHLGATVHQSAEALKRKAETLTAKSRDGKYIEKVRSELMNMAGINAAMARLSVYPEIARASEDFDANPWLIGCMNGIYNLETGRLEAGERDFMVSRQVTAHYNPDAQCPRWLACLERAQPMEDIRAFLQRLGGAVLFGHQTEHGFIFNYGSGANFKTAFSEVLRRVEGPDYAMTPNDALFFKGNQEVGLNFVADIFGMRLLTTNEREEGSEWNVSFIKKLLGGQELNACRKYCESFGFVPTARVLAAANNKPRLNELDEALRRRFLMVPWEQVIPEAGGILPSTEKDAATIIHFLKTGARIPFEFLMALLLEERDGIFRWMTDGAKDFVNRGLRLQPPAYVTAATEDYFSDEDKCGRFVEECCSIAPVPSGLSDSEAAAFLTNPEHGSLMTVVHTAFVNWAQSGKYSLGVAKFTRKLQKVSGVVTKRGTGNKMYTNVVLKAEVKVREAQARAEEDDELPF